jgi:hypothetical protein
MVVPLLTSSPEHLHSKSLDLPDMFSCGFLRSKVTSPCSHSNFKSKYDALASVLLKHDLLVFKNFCIWSKYSTYKCYLRVPEQFFFIISEFRKMPFTCPWLSKIFLTTKEYVKNNNVTNGPNLMKTSFYIV